MESGVARAEVAASAPDLIGLSESACRDTDARSDGTSIRTRAEKFNPNPVARWAARLVQKWCFINVIDRHPNTPAVQKISDGSTSA